LSDAFAVPLETLGESLLCFGRHVPKNEGKKRVSQNGKGPNILKLLWEQEVSASDWKVKSEAAHPMISTWRLGRGWKR